MEIYRIHFYDIIPPPFDGDMAGGIVPAKDVQKIFEDTFGFNSILTEEKHPNRFFAHLFFRDYFQKIPIFLQNFTSPIESIYISATFAKKIKIAHVSFLSKKHKAKTGENV